MKLAKKQVIISSLGKSHDCYPNFFTCITVLLSNMALWHKYLHGKEVPRGEICDVIKQNESEVEKHDFCFFFSIVY